jgi:hypothetical protein
MILTFCYRVLPTQQCPQSINLGHYILGRSLFAIIGTLIVPPLNITINYSSKSVKLSGLNLMTMFTARPGAISPLSYFG